MLSIFQFVVTTAAVLVLSPSVAVTSAQAQIQGDSCGACNCQFNNVELLIDLIRAEINSTISEQCQGQEVSWTPMVERIHVGDVLLETASTHAYDIPSVVPDTAREVLFTAAANCRLGGGLVNDFVQFYVEINGTRYVKLLYLIKSAGEVLPQGFNTNSDNIWLPMPPNREIYIRTTVVLTSCVAGIELIGYR